MKILGCRKIPTHLANKTDLLSVTFWFKFQPSMDAKQCQNWNVLNCDYISQLIIHSVVYNDNSQFRKFSSNTQKNFIEVYWTQKIQTFKSWLLSSQFQYADVDHVIWLKDEIAIAI